MKKNIKFLLILCVMSITSAATIAAGEQVELGPAIVSLDLKDLGSYSVDNGDVISTHHKKPNFEYDITPATIRFEGISNVVEIEVHQMSTLESITDPISRKDPVSGLEHCMEKSNMLPVDEDIQVEDYSIDGRSGLLATINRDPEKPFYILAYSPDEEDGSCALVVVVGSDLTWETTKKIFDSVETKLA